MTKTVDIQHILDFLHCATPEAWVDEAAKPENLSILLADHANLEHKAAQSAITTMKRYSHGLPGTPPNKQLNSRECNVVTTQKKTTAKELNQMYRYTGNHTLLNKMSRLAREELRHFEQVIAIMKDRGLDYLQISASRYAPGLRKDMRNEEPGRLIDTLLVSAIIEARSCERFAALVPVLDEELAEFYASLLKSLPRLPAACPRSWLSGGSGGAVAGVTGCRAKVDYSRGCRVSVSQRASRIKPVNYLRKCLYPTVLYQIY
jgi:tRNA-(ms[2]io[6]A)-hydroxylase